MTAPSSPWWYQRRSFVLFLIYLVGFCSGWGLPPFFRWVSLRIGVDAHVVLWSATALAFLGFIVRLWGSSYLSAGVVWNADALDDRLVVAGPFRYVRNPLYLGNNLMSLGIGVLASPVGFAVIVVGTVLFTALLAAHEQRLMRAKYGEVYERFEKAVPAMIPRLWPAAVAGSVRGKASIASGLRSELVMLGIAIGMLGISIEGERLFPFFAACWIGGWVLQSVLRSMYEPRATQT